MNNDFHGSEPFIEADFQFFDDEQETDTMDIDIDQRRRPQRKGIDILAMNPSTWTEDRDFYVGGQYISTNDLKCFVETFKNLFTYNKGVEEDHDEQH